MAAETKRYNYRGYKIHIHCTIQDNVSKYFTGISKDEELLFTHKKDNLDDALKFALKRIDQLESEKIKNVSKRDLVTATHRTYFNVEDNPFSLSNHEFMLKAAKGELDLNLLAKLEMANRGLGKNGEWVGFDKAAKIWGVN